MSDTSHTTSSTGASEKKVMPQLDPTYFASQLFWLGVVFVVMYLAMSRLVVPRITRVIEHRKNHVGGDLAAAEIAKAEAQAARGSYEKALADARQSANGAIAKAQSEINRTMAEEQATLDRQLAEQMAAAEATIANQLQTATRELKPLAVELAALVAGTVSQAQLSKADIEAAVNAALKE